MAKRPAPKNKPNRPEARQDRSGKPQSKPQGRPQPLSRAVHNAPALRLGAGDVLFGRHAVAAALNNPERTPRQLFVTQPDIVDELNIPASLRPQLATRQELDRLFPDQVHQGVVLVASPLPELSLDDVFRMGDQTLMLLDQVTDPHNIGAILRSAAVFGAAALITTERNAPGETAVLAKAASGALEEVPIVRVVNLARTLRELREADYWCIGLAEGGTRTLDEAVAGHKRVALVMGAEGPGLRRLTKENCDELALLPAAGSFTTLNVSNAAAVALYEVARSKK